MALKAAPAEGRQERGQAEESIARVQRRRHPSPRRGQVPFAAAAPRARLRQPPPTAAPPPPGRPPPPQVRSAAVGGALSTPPLARASGSAAASNRRHDAEAPPRWGNTATAGPAASRLLRSIPPSMPTLIPAESAHAARSTLPAHQARVMAASQDWPLPSTCHGFGACPGSPAGHVGRRPNAPDGSAGGLDFAGVRFRPGVLRRSWACVAGCGRCCWRPC
jgi:hypothetical protein